jgi:hypothetical protein
MITEEIVKELRTYQMSAMSKAADRLEELERALSETVKQRDKAIAEVERVRKLWNESHIAERDDFAKEIERVKDECRNQQPNTRPEPSRLEIAAMLLAATYGSDHVVLKAAHALQKADELIAAAKEAK